MTYDECQTLMGFLKGAFPKLTEEQVETYSSMLMMEEAESASKAILGGVNEWKFPPTWADIKERIRSIERRPGAKPTEAPPQPEPLAPEDLLIPEWVKRWTYARFVLKPPDMRPFRESYPEDVAKGNEPTAGWMPSGEYAAQAAAITDDMVRAKIAQVTGGSGLHPDTLKDLLGDT